MAITQDNIHDEFLRAGRLQAERRFDEAAALWRAITAAAPQSPEAQGNLAGVLLELGLFAEGEAAARRAVQLEPEAAWTHRLLGQARHFTHRLEEAEADYAAALALAPEDPRTRLALGHLHLARGDLLRGWPFYEARTEVADQGARRPDLPREWRGEPLAGKSILVWPEQGFGDQIQFVRFVLRLKAAGAEVTLAAPPELRALFGGLGVTVVRQTAQPPAALEQDFWTLLLSLPGRLGTTLDSLPPAPYLAAPEGRRERWRGHRLPRTVGLAWRGRATHANDAHRSLPGADGLRAALEGAGARLVDLTWPIGDFADLAAVVEQLDAVVCVDTAVAHLAGALGKRAYVLLPWYRTDWRWLEGRAESPWYPSMTLFRQPRHGDWRPAIEAAAEAWRAEFGS